MNESQPPEEPTPSGASPLMVFNSDDLFQGKREIYIVHNGELYRLIITKSGKLLLQK